MEWRVLEGRVTPGIGSEWQQRSAEEPIGKERIGEAAMERRGSKGDEWHGVAAMAGRAKSGRGEEWQ